MNPEFKIYSGILKAYESEDGRKRIKTTASSTIKDLHGDIMAESAIRQMAAQAQGRMTIFLNHSYDVPEDVFGSVEKAVVVFRDEFVDLDLDVVVEESNPRALKTYEAIKNGTKLGTSIGAMVNHWTETKEGGWNIDDVLLLEASIVSIPANPRSWVEYAVKALRSAEAPSLSVNASNTGHHTTTSNWIVSTSSPTVIESVDLDKSGEESIEPEGETETEETETVTEEVTIELSIDPDPEETQEAPEESAPEAVESGTAPDVTAENDPIDEAQAVLTAADAGLLKDVSSVLSVLKATLTQLANTKAELHKAETERDLAGTSLLTAKEIVDKVADLPLSRKTQYVAARTEFHDKLSGIYSEEFMRVLRSNEK